MIRLPNGTLINPLYVESIRTDSAGYVIIVMASGGGHELKFGTVEEAEEYASSLGRFSGFPHQTKA